MAAFMNCVACRPFELAGFDPQPPTHCRGSGDRPAPKGVLGGFVCSCPCRYRPDELWHQAEAWAKSNAAATGMDNADELRVIRYNELMVEAGHVIVKEN